MRSLTPAEEEIDPLHYDGFVVRSVEEDATASPEPEIVLKASKDPKKKKK